MIECKTLFTTRISTMKIHEFIKNKDQKLQKKENSFQAWDYVNFFPQN